MSGILFFIFASCHPLNQLLIIYYIYFATEVFVRIKNSGKHFANKMKYIWCIGYIINIEYK